MAVIAASGETLRQLNIEQPDELPRLAPGVATNTSVYGAGNLTITIRGQRQVLNNATYDSSVGVYFAEVVQARTQGLNAALFDLESVQIVKGPQGTLFGRNTTGGALLITPAAPTKEFEGYIQGTGGNYSLIDLEGAVNLPVSDKLQIRLAGKFTRHDGYFESVTSGQKFGDQDTQSWRASVRFEPTDNITNTLVVNGFHEDDAGTPYRMAHISATGPYYGLHGWPGEFQRLQSLPFTATTSTQPLGTGTKIHTLNVSNITEIDLGVGVLKNIFGYRHVNSTVAWNNQGDADASFLITAIDKSEQYSNELNFSGKAFADNLDYIVGLFWFKETALADQYRSIGWTLSSAQLAALPPLGYTVGVPGGRNVSHANADPIGNTSYSAYAQATYKLPFLPDLSLTGGIRYTRDERDITFNSFFLYFPGVNGFRCRLTTDAGVPIDPCQRSNEASWSRPTWTVSADYKVSDSVHLYVAHRRGYRAGGFTFTADRESEAEPFAPETVDDYEIGAKTSWQLPGESSLMLNVAAYYQDYKDIQRNVPLVTPAGTFVRIQNAAAGTIQGVELESKLNLGPDLELGASFAWTDAEYSSFVTDRGDFTKAPFAGVPEYAATWFARYRLLNSDRHGQVFIQANGAYQSWTTNVEATPLNQATITMDLDGTVITIPAQTLYPWDRLDARHIVDVSLAWEGIMGSDLDARLFVKNVGNQEYLHYISGGTYLQSTGSTSGIPGTPRTIGMSLRYSF